MKRIDTSTKAVDLHGAGKHGFKNGNKALGIAATKMDESVCNSWQEEICRVIEAAGIALDGAVYNQLLLALRAAGVFTTPAQFDSSTKAATMEAVQRALGNLRGYQAYTASTALTEVDIGKEVGISGTVTITLPTATGLTAGSLISLFSSGGIATIQRTGAETIVPMTGAGVTSFTMTAGDNAILMATGGGSWLLIGGSVALRYSTGDFGKSLGSSGWQKLPSGLILQWGQVTTSNSADVTATFPIAFPTAALRITLAPVCVSGLNSPGYNTLAASSVKINAWSAAATRSITQVDYMVVGH